jgi:arylsulfate sulfotransferase
MHALRPTLTALAAAFGLTACGDGDTPPMASQGKLAIQSATPGATPFLGTLQINGVDWQNVTAVDYTVANKAGAVSKPVRVRYEAAALLRKGYLTVGASTLHLPVFGLYQSRANVVRVEVSFKDGSVATIDGQLTTGSYTPQDPNYAQLTVVKPRVANDGLGFDFMLLKATVGSPIVVDTDGEIRWATTDIRYAASLALKDNQMLVGDDQTPTFKMVDFDGSAVAGTVKSTTVNNFHHNVDLGKTGFFAEFDTTIAGVRHIESQVSEIDTTGAVLQEWDFAKILSAYMTAEGDDPSRFVRPGIDWFHVNSSIYDPRDDSVIVSSRENFVVKLDYKTGKPLWILGDPQKYWYTFPSLRKLALTLDAGGLYPIGQHALSITSDGSLMLFDNGANSLNQPSGALAGATRAYSAVSKFTIDATNRRATMNWQFDNAKSIQSSYCSSAYEVTNKTLLVTYAIAGGNSARLVGLGADQKVAFDFKYPSLRCNTAWNALPITFDALQYR